MRKTALSLPRLWFAGTLLLAALLVLAGWRPAEAGRGNDELVLVEREIACNTDPAFYPGSNHYVKNGAAELLFKVDPQGVVQPSLAQGIEQVDPHTWRIRLRPEGRFWSGKSIDAESVVASLERSRRTNVRAAPFLDGLSFEPLDRWTVEVTTKRKNLSVPLSLSYMELCIINADAPHTSVETMDMSGMYRVVSFEPKKRMVLERSLNYYGEKPVIGRIVHEEISDAETRVLAILSGRADIVMHIPPEHMAQFDGRKDVVLHTTPPASTETVYLNLSRPQLRDVRVRQALSWGLNRGELVLLGAEGRSFPVTTWLGSNPRYRDSVGGIYDHYDPERAGALLDEAGWKLEKDGLRRRDGVVLSMRLMTWGPGKAVGEAIQHQWTKLGVAAEVRHGDYSLIQTARETGDWDALIEGWQTFGDEFALLSGQFAPKGTANYGGYDDAETNALLEELSNAGTEAARRELAMKVDARVAERAPCIFLYPRPEGVATRADLKGYVDHFRKFENAINAQLHFE